MGIIAKQTIKGSIYTYLGAVLGFIGAGLLMPKFLETEQIGLINLLISLTIMFSQFSSLGFVGVLTRLFPYFRENKKKHNGILTLGLIVTGVGFLLFLIFFLFSEQFLIESNIEKSELLADNIFFLPLLVFFLVFFTILDTYNKVLYDAVTGTFLREFVVRILNLILIGVYISGVISFENFIIYYVLIYISPTLIIFAILVKRKVFYLAPVNRVLFKEHKSEMIKIAGFWIVGGFSGMAVLHIDRYMTNYFLGLSATGIYSVTYNFAALIVLPSRVIKKISSIVIAESRKKGDKKTVFEIYKKSTINQMIIASFLFIGIWANIDNIFKILPKYSDGMYVILFIGIANVFEMTAGVSATVIAYSKNYRIIAYITIISLVSIIITNIIFIPIWQLNGAAFASLISIVISVLLRYLFLLKKETFQPYSAKHLKILIISIITISASYLIPEFSNYYIDILIRSVTITILFVVLIYFSKVSDDIENVISKYLKPKSIKK